MKILNPKLTLVIKLILALPKHIILTTYEIIKGSIKLIGRSNKALIKKLKADIKKARFSSESK